TRAPAAGGIRRARALPAPDRPCRRGRRRRSHVIEATTSRLARVRSFELTPAAFRSLTLLSAAALYVIVVTGATVRLTASGLGCEHWPGCQAGQPFPEKGYHSYIEFGNRLVGGIAIVLTLLAALGARRSPSRPRS